VDVIAALAPAAALAAKAAPPPAMQPRPHHHGSVVMMSAAGRNRASAENARSMSRSLLAFRCGAAGLRRSLLLEGLAEGEELGSNILQCNRE
jgi:hypothetical protein